MKPLRPDDLDWTTIPTDKRRMFDTYQAIDLVRRIKCNEVADLEPLLDAAFRSIDVGELQRLLVLLHDMHEVLLDIIEREHRAAVDALGEEAAQYIWDHLLSSRETFPMREANIQDMINLCIRQQQSNATASVLPPFWPSTLSKLARRFRFRSSR